MFSLLCVGGVKGQGERAELQGFVHTEIGPEFAVATMLDVDASLRKSGRGGEGALESIEDPYGTLTGAIIFSAYAERMPDDSNMGTLGVYREGRILWAAPPDTLEYCERPTDVMAVRDLDRNERVDIVFEWRGCYPTNLLWIYSWDGQTGTAMHEIDRYGRSTIGVSRGYFDLADVDGDGTIEIIARTHRRVFEDDREMLEPQLRVFSAKDGKFVEATD